MSEPLSELEGCDLLARLFAARGYRLARNVVFREYGVTFHIDGWDAAARVGFEFLTSEDDDHDDLTLEGYKTLMAAQQRGELALFIIDEVETLSAAELTATTHEFLDEVAAAARARLRRGQSQRHGPPTVRPASIGARSAAKRPAAGRTTGVTTRAAKGTVRKAAGKTGGKPAGKVHGKTAGKTAATIAAKTASKAAVKSTKGANGNKVARGRAVATGGGTRRKKSARAMKSSTRR